MNELLLFDDSEKNVDTILDPLEEDAGFEVTWVRDVEELNNVIEPDKFKGIVTDVSIESLIEADLIRNSTKKVKVFLDTDSCPKMNLKGIKTTASVKKLIEDAGGSIEV